MLKTGDNIGDKVDKRLSDKQLIGQLGEEKVSLLLSKQGFSVLDRNYRKSYGEIDIVAKKGSTLHFFEVKTVSRVTLPKDGDDDYFAEENIHLWKTKRLSRVVQVYLAEKKISEEIDWQVDAAMVYLEKNTNKVLKIEFLEDILV